MGALATEGILHGYGDPVAVGDIAEMVLHRHDGTHFDEGEVRVAGWAPEADGMRLEYERWEPVDHLGTFQWVPCQCLVSGLTIGRRTLRRVPRRGEVGR